MFAVMMKSPQFIRNFASLWLDVKVLHILVHLLVDM